MFSFPNEIESYMQPASMGGYIDDSQAVRLLKAGDIVALPTETVYGLAGNAYENASVQRIFFLKQRPLRNPLIVHYADIASTHRDVIWTPLAETLAKAFWPGPLTLVLSCRPDSPLSPYVRPHMDTVAIRIPQHPVMRKILQELDFPLAAPSANPSGYLSPTHPQHVRHGFPNLPILQGGPSQYGLESSVVDARGSKGRLLRLGALTAETLANIIPLETPDLSTSSSPLLCPGMAFRHYAPKKPLRLEALSFQENEGVLCFGPTGTHHPIHFQLSLKKDLEEAARQLFHALYSLDQSSCEGIAVVPLPRDGLGQAIYDRLEKAAQGAPKT